MENEEKWFHVEPTREPKQENSEALINIITACMCLLVALIISYLVLFNVVSESGACVILACCALICGFFAGRCYEIVKKREWDEE